MINVGVVGAGYWGPNLIRNFSQIDATNLHSVCDLDESKLKKIKSTYPKVNTTKNFDDLLNNDEIDAIAIATFPSTHYPLGKKVLESGKSVFIEKPMALSSSDGQELIDLAKKQKKDIKKISFFDTVIIGIFQALAILPGVSRSGSTISSGLFRKVKKEDAFKFSFFLGIIAIFGATLLQIPKISNFTFMEALTAFWGFIFSAIVGYFAMETLKKVVINGKLHYFGIYCAILGVACIAFSVVA